MKKTISLLLVVGICVCLCACGSNGGAKRIEDRLIVGKWVSDRTEMDGRLTNFTITFFSDGSAKLSYYDTAFSNQIDNSLTWTVSEPNTVSIGLITFSKYTYTNDNSVEKLMAPQADGYWYEHVVE